MEQSQILVLYSYCWTKVKLPVLRCVGCRPSHIMLDFPKTFVTHRSTLSHCTEAHFLTANYTKSSSSLVSRCKLTTCLKNYAYYTELNFFVICIMIYLSVNTGSNSMNNISGACHRFCASFWLFIRLNNLSCAKRLILKCMCSWLKFHY